MTVTFFGHRDAPIDIKPLIKATLTDLIENHNATTFYVGNNGNFDLLVQSVLKELSTLYPIDYSIVFAYLPDKKSEQKNFENTIYPEGLETVPKRFAISKRNEWMLKQSDTVITYVTHPSSGAWEWVKKAEKLHKVIININN